MSNSQTPLTERGALELRNHFGVICAEVHETNSAVQVTRTRRTPARPCVIVSDAMWHAACERHPKLKPGRDHIADVMTSATAAGPIARNVFLPVAREGMHVPVSAMDDWAVWFVPSEWWAKVAG